MLGKRSTSIGLNMLRTQRPELGSSWRDLYLRKASETEHSRQSDVPWDKSQDRTVCFSVRIAFARVRAALGKPAEARTILKATLAEAMKCGFVNYQLDARLALGEIEMKSGKTSAGHGRLAILEKDATARGFLLIARKAHDATQQ